ncbi:MAG: PHP domain-containing protein [Chloroflexi bacterium]|nr:PHP domain-containing protein [Chloroflexota bacterium]
MGDTIFKIDLHVHSSERSPCGKASEEAQIRAAIAAKLDAIVFTDHWTFVSAERLKQLNEKYAPFKIFGGIEVVADDEDFVVIGVRDRMLNQSGSSYADLHALVRQHDGFIALVHPFRYRNEIKADIERHKPDAIEVRSTNTLASAEQRICELAARLGIPTLCNSDAHNTDAFGKYHNTLEKTPADERELIELLKGRASC